MRPSDFKKIDVHVHLHPDRLSMAIQKWFRENHAWPLDQSFEPEDVTRILRQNGVSRFVFCSYAHKTGMAASLNQWLIETSNKIGRYGLPLLTVHLDDANYRDDAKRAIAGGCIGMKVHEDVQKLAIDDPRFDSVYEQITAINGFVLAHVGPIPWKYEAGVNIDRVKNVTRKHPGLNLVLAHMGAPDTVQYCEMLESAPGLLLDTTACFSSVMKHDATISQDILERYSGRILYGTDYPVIPHKYELEFEKLASMGLSESGFQSIMFDNAEQLLAPFL